MFDISYCITLDGEFYTYIGMTHIKSIKHHEKKWLFWFVKL